MSLVGCTVLITGGGSGIGRATAVAFAEENANVVLVDRCEEALLHTKNLVAAKGAQCATFFGDVKDSSTAVESVLKAVEAFGELTFAVNCAGIEGQRAAVHEMPEENLTEVLDTNLKGVFLFMQQELRQFLKQGKSKAISNMPFSIVNVASTAGLRGMPEFSAYCASKHALIGLSQSAALEYAKSNIRVNICAPATTDTPMVARFAQQWPEWQQKTNASYPPGRIAAPEEIANAIVFLSRGDRCGFLNGHVLAIDGGALCS